MRFFGAIIALTLGIAPLAVAKDQPEKGSEDRKEVGKTSRGADDDRRDEKVGPRQSSADNADRDEPSIEPAVELERNDPSEIDTPDKKPIKAPTAPVPVKSLGISPGLKTREAETRKVRIGKIGESATVAAKARKARSEEILRADGVPLNLKLPAIVDAGQTTGRTHRQVVGRTLAILTTAVKGEGLDQSIVDALIEDFEVQSFLTPEEAAFIAQLNPPTVDRVQFAWRYEAAWDLGPPREIVDVRAIGEIVRGETVDSIVAKTQLRSMDELLDQADLIYRYRWALVDARVHDREPPADLDPGVALERHRALNWLIGYLGQEWDDVTPDT